MGKKVIMQKVRWKYMEGRREGIRREANTVEEE
jgi:hypothetical protein